MPDHLVHRLKAADWPTSLNQANDLVETIWEGLPTDERWNRSVRKQTPIPLEWGLVAIRLNGDIAAQQEVIRELRKSLTGSAEPQSNTPFTETELDRIAVQAGSDGAARVGFGTLYEMIGSVVNAPVAITSSNQFVDAFTPRLSANQNTYNLPSNGDQQRDAWVRRQAYQLTLTRQEPVVTAVANALFDVGQRPLEANAVLATVKIDEALEAAGLAHLKPHGDITSATYTAGMRERTPSEAFVVETAAAHRVDHLDVARAIQNLWTEVLATYLDEPGNADKLRLLIDPDRTDLPFSPLMVSDPALSEAIDRGFHDESNFLVLGAERILE